MIHKEDNTDINIIKKNYGKLKDENKDKDNCVLITTGSFNPIHRSHIKNLQLVKTYLEKYAIVPMNVLAAYISPTHDGYVGGKLSRIDHINGKDRCELCDGAIQEETEEANRRGEPLEEYISVSRAEINHHYFVDFDTVSISLQKFLNSILYGNDSLLKQPLKVVYVCGLDHLNKCSHVVSLSTQPNIACAVIYRPGASEHYIKSPNKNAQNIYYIDLNAEREVLRDISSTVIRKQYRTLDGIDPDQSSYECVKQYYRNRLSHNTQ